MHATARPASPSYATMTSPHFRRLERLAAARGIRKVRGQYVNLRDHFRGHPALRAFDAACWAYARATGMPQKVEASRAAARRRKGPRRG